MIRPRLSALALSAVGVLLSACVVGPGYRTPAPPTPTAGIFSATLPATAGTADQPPPNWWKLYNDPAIDTLVQEALTHNTNLEVAAANLAEARAALSLAKAGRYPSTTLSTSAQYGVASTAAGDAAAVGQTATPTGFYAAGLDASYEIDLFGRVRRAVQAARADLEAQKAAEDVVRVSVAGETTRAYLNACAYAEELAVARQSVDIVTQTYNLTVTEARFGVASDFDLARERQLVAQTQATVPGYEGQRRTALFELAVLTGRPPEEISKAADACKAPPKLTTLFPTGEVQGLFRRRPDVRQAERHLAGDFARIGVATANLFPTVSIGLFGQTAASTLSGLTSLNNLSYGVGPNLSWAFPNVLVALAQVREARATASASYASFQGSVLQALQDTEEALTNYGAELDRHASLITSRDQSRIAFKLAQIQYQNGSASFLDVLTAETNLVDANQQLAASDEAVVSDQVTLFKALGGGWEQAPEVQALPLRDAKSGKTIEVR
jgi:NodT family efflux transporter outer membrane factor (OMF) lipoprotein